jgi:pyruvate,water dikinase
LRQLSERWLNSDLADIHNDLVAGEAGIISLEPVRRMKEMAVIASGDQAFVMALCDAPVAVVQKHIARNPVFQEAYAAYLDRFGDRCLDELKLESLTLGDDPLPLLRAVGQLARTSHSRTPDAGQRHAAEKKVAMALRSKPVHRIVYNAVLRLARARVRDRENLRFERTRVYGRVRAVFLAIGRRLEAEGVLAAHDDIFYLDVAEVTGFIRGTGISCNLAALTGSRRREFAEYLSSDDPPRRFMTCGPAQLPSSMRLLPETGAGEQGDLRSGQACSPGVVRGPVRIVRDPRKSNVRHGEILVAQRTDPGWVTIFPLVSGMIMERGSLLSHSAIVARELGIPAVVGVEDACRWLNDGDWVELDGATGTIRRLERTEQAA